MLLRQQRYYMTNNTTKREFSISMEILTPRSESESKHRSKHKISSELEKCVLRLSSFRHQQRTNAFSVLSSRRVKFPLRC